MNNLNLPQSLFLAFFIHFLGNNCAPSLCLESSTHKHSSSYDTIMVAMTWKVILILRWLVFLSFSHLSTCWCLLWLVDYNLMNIKANIIRGARG